MKPNLAKLLLVAFCFLSDFPLKFPALWVFSRSQLRQMLSFTPDRPNCILQLQECVGNLNQGKWTSPSILLAEGCPSTSDTSVGVALAAATPFPFLCRLHCNNSWLNTVREFPWSGGSEGSWGLSMRPLNCFWQSLSSAFGGLHRGEPDSPCIRGIVSGLGKLSRA